MGEEKWLVGEILRCGPSQSTLFVVLKHIKAQGRVREVIQECIKALRVFPDDIHLQTLLAECYLEVGFIGQAKTQLIEITSQLEELISVYKHLGQIYSQERSEKEATKALRIYMAHRPDDSEALSLLEALEKKSLRESPLTEEPEEPIAEGEADEFTAGLATPTLAEIIYEQGQTQEAIRVYEKIVADNPVDHASAKRLAELKGILAQKAPVQRQESPPTSETQRAIAVMEAWLARIRKFQHASSAQ
jgi:tetratricopeptide (TPR) repeat protein